jgi:hypothetical protein
LGTWGRSQVLKFCPHCRYVYGAGALNRPDKIQAQVIDVKVVVKELKKDFEISRISRF